MAILDPRKQQPLCDCGWTFPSGVNALVVHELAKVVVSLECPQCKAIWLFPLPGKAEPAIADLPLLAAIRAR